jgi:hypothetical protein
MDPGRSKLRLTDLSLNLTGAKNTVSAASRWRFHEQEPCPTFHCNQQHIIAGISNILEKAARNDVTGFDRQTLVQMPFQKFQWQAAEPEKLREGYDGVLAQLVDLHASYNKGQCNW